MKLVKLTVLFLIIRAVQCVEPEVCSNDDEVFRGIARDRFVISYSKTVTLDIGNLYSVCDAGVNCREFCLVDSLEWNFFEAKKVYPYHDSHMPFRNLQSKRCAVVSRPQTCHLSIPCHFGIMDSSMEAYLGLEVDILSPTIIIKFALSNMLENSFALHKCFC